MIRAVFFDFDGVLVDSEPLHLECWAEVLAEYGMALDAAQYLEKFIGVSNQEMIEILCRQNGRGFDRRFFTECYDKKKKIYEKRIERCRTPEELAEFIRTRSRDFRFGVVSSSARCEVEPHLVREGLREPIAAMVCQEDGEEFSPARELYRLALRLVNAGAGRVIEPAECLVVEDSGPGAESGRLAGMEVVRVSGPEEVCERITARVHSLAGGAPLAV